MRRLHSIGAAALALGLVVAAPASAHDTPAAAGSAASPYAPYETLIGDWDLSGAHGPIGMTLRFGWGPAHSYITVSAVEQTQGGEHTHFDGVMMWDGATHALDVLVMLDVSSGASVHEEGAFLRQANGSFVREITAVYSQGAALPSGGRAGPEGARVHFRQTYLPGWTRPHPHAGDAAKYRRLLQPDLPGQRSAGDDTPGLRARR
jgi:hypothetical protein